MSTEQLDLLAAGDADDAATIFFKPPSRAAADESDDTDEARRRQTHLLSPGVRARRQYLMRYVAVSVGVASMICAAAVVRGIRSHAAIAAASRPPPTRLATPVKAPEAPPVARRRRIAEAIEAGERSVALDPSDAEAWLIRRECAALLR